MNQIYQNLSEDADPDVVEMLVTFVEYIRHGPAVKMAEDSPVKQILEGLCQSRLNGQRSEQTLGCLLEMLRRNDVQTFSIVANQIMQRHDEAERVPPPEGLVLEMVGHLNSSDGRIRNFVLQLLDKLVYDHQNKTVLRLLELNVDCMGNGTSLQQMGAVVAQFVNYLRASVPKMDETELKIAVFGSFGLLYSKFDTVQQNLPGLFDLLTSNARTRAVILESGCCRQLADVLLKDYAALPELEDFASINTRYYQFDIMSQGGAGDDVEESAQDVKKLQTQVRQAIIRYKSSIMFLDTAKLNG